MTRQEYEAKYGALPTLKQDVPEADATRGFAVGLGTGFAKGVGDLALGVGEIGRGIQRGVSKGVDATFGTQNFGLGDSPFDKENASRIRQEKFTPNQPGEGTGKFVADVASFAIPGGAAWRATKGASLLPRIGGQVASDVAVQTVQDGGDMGRSTVDTAILAAVVPGGQAGVQALKGKIGPDLGGRIIDSLIKPLSRDFAFGKNPGGAVAKAGITANSFEDLAQNIGREIDATSAQAKQIYQSRAVALDISDFAKPVGDALEQARKNPNTNAALITRLENLRADFLQLDDAGNATRKMTGLTADEALDLKREIGTLTQWTDNRGGDDVLNKAIQRTYGQIKGKLDEAYPEAKELNETIGSLISAQQATIHREAIVKRSNIMSFSVTTAGGTGALVGLVASGGSITPALVVGAGAAGLQKAMATPTGKTKIASWFASLPPEEKASLLKEAPWVRSVIQASLFDEEESLGE